jgi:branched-subunit amino acid ABC-type transport system permease component
VLASLAAGRTGAALAVGAPTPDALTSGYSLAFIVGAACAGVASMLGGLFMRERAPAPGEAAPVAMH